MSDDQVLRDRAARLARPVAVATRDGVAAIVVLIGEQRYAFPVADVRRVAVVRAITPMPHLPPAVLGLGNSEGDVLAIFDARVWAGGARRVQFERIPVVMIGRRATPLTLAVDALLGSAIISPPLARSERAPPWLAGMTTDGILVVRTDALLTDPMFSLGNRSTEGAVDDDHQED